MSLIVAIKDGNRIVLGADKQVSTGTNKDHTCTKIWKLEELPGAIMGGVGTARGNQIIQYNQIIDKNAVDPKEELDTGFIVNHLVPTLVGALKSSGLSCDVPDREGMLALPNAFLFAYKSRAWMIWHDLSVMEISEYFTIGSGSDVANGVLFATKRKNPFERIVTCIDAAAESTLYVDNGVDLLTTVQKETDFKHIRAALEEEPEPNSEEFAAALDMLQSEFESKFKKEKLDIKQDNKKTKKPAAKKEKKSGKKDEN